MRNKVVFLIAFLMLTASIGNAQGESNEKVYRIEDNSHYYDNIEVNRELAGSHYLGDQIANELYILKEAFTTVQPATPTSPSEKTIVEKPVIYYAINRLNRKYKREIRKGHIEEHQVKENLSGVIIKALSLLHAETEAFEAELKKAKSPTEIMLVFNKVVVE